MFLYNKNLFQNIFLHNKFISQTYFLTMERFWKAANKLEDSNMIY